MRNRNPLRGTIESNSGLRLPTDPAGHDARALLDAMLRLTIE